MDKKQELIKAIEKYPERRLVVMFSNEGNDDYAYTLGEITNVDVTEMIELNERVYFSDEVDLLLETFEECLFDELYGSEPYNRVCTNEENEELERLAKEELSKCNWEPVIVIYVSN